jgi:cytochrome bd-type quinol oxidase subunit 2
LSIAILNNTMLMRLIRSAAMLGGFLLLLCEIRFEHRAVLIDDWRPWIPLILCGFMMVAIPVATFLWDKGGKKALLGLYFVTSCLGAVGLFFHAEGHLWPRLIELFTVWTSSLQTGAAIKANHPPLLAPAAFMGLGLIGALLALGDKTDG